MKKAIAGPRTRERLGEPIGPYSYGVEARGRIIYVAGQIARMHGEVVGKGDFGAQYRHILENVKAVLEDAGASMDDVVKLVHYAVPRIRPDSAQFKSMIEVRKEFFEKDFPASTLIQVAGLVFDDLLLEVDAVAVAD